MFTRNSKLPLAAGLFGRKNGADNRDPHRADNDDGRPRDPHQGELNRRAVAFTTRGEDNLAA